MLIEKHWQENVKVKTQWQKQQVELRGHSARVDLGSIRCLRYSLPRILLME